MLVTDLVNVRYLSGFTGSNAALLVRVSDTTPILATDGRYRTQAAKQSPDAEVVIERACAPHLAGRAAADGLRYNVPQDVTATVTLTEAPPLNGQRQVTADVRINPPDILSENPNWVALMAWQGKLANEGFVARAPAAVIERALAGEAGADQLLERGPVGRHVLGLPPLRPRPPTPTGAGSHRGTRSRSPSTA